MCIESASFESFGKDKKVTGVKMYCFLFGITLLVTVIVTDFTFLVRVGSTVGIMAVVAVTFAENGARSVSFPAPTLSLTAW